MKIRCLPLAAALALCAAPLAAVAQASAPPPTSAASALPVVPAVPALPTGPRLMTPAQSRDLASPPGELRPERPVTPQISIPLGKKPPAPLQPESRGVRRGNAASAGAIDDAAARCEAQRGEQVRAKCRDKLAREARRRAPV